MLNRGSQIWQILSNIEYGDSQSDYQKDGRMMSRKKVFLLGVAVGALTMYCMVCSLFIR